MMHGPKIILQEAAKCGSRTLRARLAPELPHTVSGSTHAGLWCAGHLPADLLRITSIREPIAWHVSHFLHWLDAWRAGFDRVTAWMRPEVASFAADLLNHEAAPPSDPDTLAILWAGYVEGVTDPRVLDVSLHASAPNMAWRVPPQDMPIRRWMVTTGLGLHSWAYVRSYMAREDWLRPVPALIDAARSRPLYGAAIDTAQIDRALPELAAHYDLAIVDCPRIGRARSAPRIVPTDDQIERIRAYERLSYAVHGWGEDMLAITWGDRA